MITNRAIYYEQDLRTPQTVCTIYFHGAGSQQESSTGLAHMTSRMLFRGTRKHSRNDIQRQFDLWGASLSVSLNETDFFIRIHCLSDTFENTIAFVYECIEEAEFPEDEFETVKKLEKSRLTSFLQDQDAVLRAGHRYNIYDNAMHGKHGSHSVLDSLTTRDVENYFEKVKHTEIIYATCISDIPQARIEHLISKTIYHLPSGGFSLLPEREYKVPDSTEVWIIESPQATNDRLMWSIPGIAIHDQRRFALSLTLDALGSFEGYLFDELRNKNGWCYGAYASLIPGSQRKGRIYFYADPSNETSQYLVPAMLNLLQTFNSAPAFLERLKDRKETFINRYSYQLDKGYRLMNRINYDRFGLPILNKDKYRSAIESVTESQYVSLFEDLFSLDNMIMTFYGDSERIGKTIRAIDPLIPVHIFQKDDLVS